MSILYMTISLDSEDEGTDSSTTVLVLPSPDYVLASPDYVPVLDTEIEPLEEDSQESGYDPKDFSNEEPSKEDPSQVEEDEPLPAQVAPAPPTQATPIVRTSIIEPGQTAPYYLTDFTPMSEAKETVLERRMRAMEEHFGPASNSYGNGINNETSGSAGGVEHATHGCSYNDFLICKPCNFNRTEGAVGLTRWFEKMEYWNAYVQSVGLDAAYETTWKKLRKMMIEEYCPRNELQLCELKLQRVLITKGSGMTIKGVTLVSKTKDRKKLGLILLDRVKRRDMLGPHLSTTDVKEAFSLDKTHKGDTR
ncbi:hypothetical protein Tco_0845477 [Tanacetum coccineum]